MSDQRLSLVLPCRNEEAAVSTWLRDLLRRRQDLAQAMGLSEIEVIVVDDGSNDASLSLLRPLQNELRLIVSPAPLGYGAALKLGFQQATGNWIAFCDLDGTYDINEFPRLFQELQVERADIVCGDRLHDLRNMPLSRRLGNYLFRAVIRGAFAVDVADACSGQRLFRTSLREDFYRLLPNQLDFALGMTLHGLKQGWCIRELPVRYQRRLGRSKLSVVRDGLRFLNTIRRCSRLRFADEKLLSAKAKEQI